MPLKIGGTLLDGPKKTLLVIPRDTGDLVFRFKAVTDDSPFDLLCPKPKPPISIKTGVGKVENTTDSRYLDAIAHHNVKRYAWYFLKSTEESNIEWSTIKMDDPNTWENWRKELTDAGLSARELDALVNKFTETNMVTEAMLDEARTRFLASQQETQLEKQ